MFLFYINPAAFTKSSDDDKRKRKGTGNRTGGSAGGRTTMPKQKSTSRKRGGGFTKRSRSLVKKMVWDAKAKMYVPIQLAKEQAKSFMRDGIEHTKSEAYKYVAEKTTEWINEKRSVLIKNRTDSPTATGGGGGALATRSYSGSSLFKNPVLPLGSTMKASVSMGINKLPKQSIAQTTKFDVLNTEGQVIVDETTGASDFRKSGFGEYKKVSINQTYYELFPLCIPSAFERRLSLMDEMSYSGSHQADYNVVQNAFDNPGSVLDDLEPLSNQRLEKYIPFNIYNKIKLNNISKVLPARVKLHFVQLKNNANFAGAAGDETAAYPIVSTGIGGVVDAVLTDTIEKDRSYTTSAAGELCGPGTGLFRTTNKMRWDNTVPPGASTESEVWGLRDQDGSEPMNTCAFAMRTGRLFQNLPQFDEHFHIVKTSSFKVGAGNSVEVDVASHYNKCFSKMGTLNQLNPDTSSGYQGCVNRYTPEQLLCLIEIKGAANQAFYEYEAGPTANDDPSRTWGIAKSSSANVNISVKTSYEFAVKTDIDQAVNGTENKTEIYSRNYLDCPGTKNVGLDVIPLYSQLKTMEPETWVSGDRCYIEPVRTDTTTIGAGVKVGNN